MRFRRLTYHILLALLLVTGCCHAQNLVPNGSFETYTACPTANGIFKLNAWCGLGGGEDAYNACFNSIFSGPGGFGIPYTFFGFQYPRSGDGLGSFFVFLTGANVQDRREYIQVPLTQALKAGRTYCGTMYLNLYNESKYATDQVGMYFSVSPFACNQAFPNPQYIAPLRVTPQIANASGNYIRDTLNWVEVSGTFVASGNEQYLTIGNFLDDASTNKLLVNPSSAYTVVIYLVDDVSLEEIDPARGIGSATLCAGDSLALSRAPASPSAQYSWYPAAGLSCTACAQPMASPQSSTTYTLSKTQCRSTTTTEVSISVKADCSLEERVEIPNVFTPNEDGLNDSFRAEFPEGFQVEEFAVYNRWGNLIHRTERRQQRVLLWDGRSTAGEACPAGVYYYVLRYTDAKGEASRKNGFITLMR